MSTQPGTQGVNVDALRAVVRSWRAEGRQLIDFATAGLPTARTDRPVHSEDPDAVARLDALSRASALNAAARDVEHIIGPDPSAPPLPRPGPRPGPPAGARPTPPPRPRL